MIVGADTNFIWIEKIERNGALVRIASLATPVMRQEFLPQEASQKTGQTYENSLVMTTNQFCHL